HSCFLHRADNLCVRRGILQRRPYGTGASRGSHGLRPTRRDGHCGRSEQIEISSSASRETAQAANGPMMFGVGTPDHGAQGGPTRTVRVARVIARLNVGGPAIHVAALT